MVLAFVCWILKALKDNQEKFQEMNLRSTCRKILPWMKVSQRRGEASCQSLQLGSKEKMKGDTQIFMFMDPNPHII